MSQIAARLPRLLTLWLLHEDATTTEILGDLIGGPIPLAPSIRKRHYTSRQAAII